MYDNNKKLDLLYRNLGWLAFIGVCVCEIIACITLAFQGSTSDWITERKNNLCTYPAYQQQKLGDLSRQREPRQDF